MPVTTASHPGRFEHDDARQPRSGRRRYVAPALVEYGTVAKLTQAGGVSFNDFMGMMSMACL
jgi:hypothetical protein